MDIINGIGTVFIVAISLLLAPFAWLVAHPLLLAILVGAGIAIVLINRKAVREKEAADKAAYEAAVQADPFIAIPRKEVERWNGIRDCCETEEEWQRKRRSIIEQIHRHVKHLEDEQESWRCSERMYRSYEPRIAAALMEAPWWEDGGIFDKPLSWGKYKYED